jgi:hypothetical protein
MEVEWFKDRQKGKKAKKIKNGETHLLEGELALQEWSLGVEI